MCSQWLSFPMDFLPKPSFLPTAPPNSFLGPFCYSRTMAGQVEVPWFLVIPCCHVTRFLGFCCLHRFKKYFTFWQCYIWALCLHNFSPSPPTPPGLCPPTRCFPSSWLHILNSVLKNRFQNLVWPALWVLQSDSIGIFSATNLCNGGVTVSPRTERDLNLRSAVRLSLDQCPSLFPLSFWNGFCFFPSSPWSRAGGPMWFMSYWSVTFFYKLSVFFLLPFGFPKLLLMVFFGMESVFPLLFWPFSISPHVFSLSGRLSLEKVWSLLKDRTANQRHPSL